MNISRLFEKEKIVFSFEIFPPKYETPIEIVYDTLEALGDLSPDYISVTYGAGGNSRDNRTCEVASIIKNKHKIEPLAHLTCIGSTKEDIKEILDDLKKNGVQNILALRGDKRDGEARVGDFRYASDLIEYIKSIGDFNVVAACYPEKHLDCNSIDDDVNNLKNKVDKGVGHLVSQLFFDNNSFYNFREKLTKKGINIPITAGIMPLTQKNQITKMANMCGAKIPSKYLKMIDKYENDKTALRDAGIFYATEQIIDLIANGVRGVHLYTMNNPVVARKISINMANIIK